jgi:hypothetical protein
MLPRYKKSINYFKKKYKIAIITSKERKSSVFTLRKKKIKYDMLITPNDAKKENLFQILLRKF